MAVFQSNYLKSQPVYEQTLGQSPKDHCGAVREPRSNNQSGAVSTFPRGFPGSGEGTNDLLRSPALKVRFVSGSEFQQDPVLYFLPQVPLGWVSISLLLPRVLLSFPASLLPLINAVSCQGCASCNMEETNAFFSLFVPVPTF